MTGIGRRVLTDGAGVHRLGSPAGRIDDGKKEVEAGVSWREVYTQSREEGGGVERQDGGLRRKGKDAEEEMSLGKGDVISKSGGSRGWLRLLRGEATTFPRSLWYIVALYIGTIEILQGRGHHFLGRPERRRVRSMGNKMRESTIGARNAMSA